MPINDVAGGIIAAFQAGQQERLQQQRFQEDQEDRKLRQESLKLALAQQKLEGKLQARQLQLQNFQLMNGRISERDPNISRYTQGGTLPSQNLSEAPAAQAPNLAPATISGIPEMGVGDLTLPMQTKEEGLREALGDLMAKARLKWMTEGHSVPAGGVYAAPAFGRIEGPPRVERPVQIDQGGKPVWVNPKDAVGKPGYVRPRQGASTTPTPAQIAQNDRWLAGQRQQAENRKNDDLKAAEKAFSAATTDRGITAGEEYQAALDRLNARKVIAQQEYEAAIKTAEGGAAKLRGGKADPGQTAPPEADVREQVRAYLQQNGKASDDAAIDLVLKNPNNRKALGLQ